MYNHGPDWSELYFGGLCGAVAEVQEAPVFTGTYEHQLDEANRLVMPAKLRDKLDGTLFLSLGKGEHRHLVLLPDPTRRLLVEKLHGVDPFGDANDDVRDMFSDAEYVTIEAQGRLSIPASLRKAANLRHKVVILGAFNRVEIWDQETYHAYRRQRGRPV